MSVYFVANIRIHDEAEYEKYLERVDEVFSSINGTYLSVDNCPEVIEGHWNYSRFVLIEFPDKESLHGWYHSSRYQEILRHRLSAADCDSIIVEQAR